MLVAAVKGMSDEFSRIRLMFGAPPKPLARVGGDRAIPPPHLVMEDRCAMCRLECKFTTRGSSSSSTSTSRRHPPCSDLDFDAADDPGPHCGDECPSGILVAVYASNAVVVLLGNADTTNPDRVVDATETMAAIFGCASYDVESGGYAVDRGRGIVGILLRAVESAAGASERMARLLGDLIHSGVAIDKHVVRAAAEGIRAQRVMCLIAILSTNATIHGAHAAIARGAPAPPETWRSIPPGTPGKERRLAEIAHHARRAAEPFERITVVARALFNRLLLGSQIMADSVAGVSMAVTFVRRLHDHLSARGGCADPAWCADYDQALVDSGDNTAAFGIGPYPQLETTRETLQDMYARGREKQRGASGGDVAM
jgi:hypothetical protein